MAELKRDVLLVLQAQKGDRAALECVLCAIQASLLRYISGIAGRSGAEDILQDVFLDICRNLKWLRSPELFQAWAYRIASRACFKQLKRERRWSNRDQTNVPVDELPAPDDPELSKLFLGMSEMIEQISPASRAVLLLHYAQDLSIDEAAAILDISIGTAKSRLAYGLNCLRKSLKGTTKT